MFEAIVIALGAIWFFYKWIAKKEMKYLLIPLILVLIQLPRWPFFLNRILIFGIINIVAAVFLGIEFYVKKRISGMYLYIIILLGVGAMLLAQAFLINRVV